MHKGVCCAACAKPAQHSAGGPQPFSIHGPTSTQPSPLHPTTCILARDLPRFWSQLCRCLAHITFATLALPADKVQRFAALLHAAARHLPDPSKGCYKIVHLQHFDKRSRRDAAVKGSIFYYLDLEGTTSDFVDNQSIWLDALKSIAQQVGGSCKNFRSINQQHMTVRSFRLRDATNSFHHIRKEVQAHPATMNCAGIRIQQSVTQALEAGADHGFVVHAYFYKPQARYPVCLYSSCMQASHHARLQGEQMRRKQKAAAADQAACQAAVEQVLEQLILGIGHCVV